MLEGEEEWRKYFKEPSELEEKSIPFGSPF